MKIVHGFLGDLAQFFGLCRPLPEHRDQGRSTMQKFVSVNHNVASKC